MHSVVFKNDAVGDLAHSLTAINNIVSSNENKKVTVFLSNLSKKYSFLLDNPKVDIKILNYNLNIKEKIKLFSFLLINKINKVYILSPKNFYYFLPIFFRKIKFYAICINNIKNYKRPGFFLRKFLFKYEINHREIAFKRDSIKLIQFRLTSENINTIDNFNISLNISKSAKLAKYLPTNYVYFHFKKKTFKKLGWNMNQLKILFKKFNNYYPNIVLTKDIEIDENTEIFRKYFNMYNFETDEFVNNNSNVIFFDNIAGEDLYNVIKFSKKIVAFNGMMTSLASLEKKPVLDLFYCKINSWEDYRRHRNCFYEFKPKYKDYNFIIPNKDINKTVKKINFAFK
jgi:hypothetical protein